MCFFNLNLFKGMCVCVCVCVYVCVYVCVCVCVCVRIPNFSLLDRPLSTNFLALGSSGEAEGPGCPFDLSRGGFFYSARLFDTFLAVFFYRTGNALLIRSEIS